MTQRASEEWSRGRSIGDTSINRQVALLPIGRDEVLLVWPNPDGQLEMAWVDGDGDIATRRTLPAGGGEARDPQVRAGSDGRLHLVWREEGETRHRIFHMLLSADGDPLSEPLMLSDPSRRAFLDRVQLQADSAGRMHILWTEEDGIIWAAVGQDGKLVQGPALLAAEGRAPSARMDRSGVIHLTWWLRTDANNLEVVYAVLDPSTGELSEPQKMGRVFLSVGQVLEGPDLALDEDTGHILWTVRDLRVVSSESFYASFPLDVPDDASVQELSLLQVYDVTGICSLQDQYSVPLIAFSATASTPEAGVELQTVVATLSAEGVLTEQIVTDSPSASVRPSLARDIAGNLHLVWLDTAGFRHYEVNYASTSPDVMQNYNAVILWDIVNPALNSIVQFLTMSVLVIVPMLLLWFVVPLLGLLVYHILTGEERLDLNQSRVVLVLVIALEVGLSLVFAPGAYFGNPVRTTVFGLPMRWLVPVVDAAAGIAAVVYFARWKSKGESLLFLSFFVFSGVYTLLGLIAYFLP